ncbi:MAG: hypothetical protein ACOC8Y_01860, partial [Candidatus Natronoplasma sp.]
LYMMVGDIGGDGGTSVAGKITDREIDDTDEVAQFEFISLSTPSSAAPEDLEITVLGDEVGGADTDEVTISGDADGITWTLLDDDEVASGTRFDIFTEIDGDPEDIEEVVIRIDGYTGTISWEA